MTKLVTIYITTKNRCDLLKRAIDSVLNQTYKNIEVIIVNDGSIDTTNQLLSQHKDSRIKVINNRESKGACYCRNLAIKHATGYYITGMDDDDEFTVDRVEKFVNLSHLLDDGFSALCASLMLKHQRRTIMRKNNVGKIDIDLILYKNVIGNQIFTKIDYIRKIGGFDIAMPAMQDYDTWVRLINEVGPVYKMRDVTYIVHTDHDNPRITNFINRRNAVDIFIKKHFSLMNKRHLKAAEIHRKICHRERISLSEFISLYLPEMRRELCRYFVFSNFKFLENIKLSVLGLKQS